MRIIVQHPGGLCSFIDDSGERNLRTRVAIIKGVRYEDIIVIVTEVSEIS